MVCCRGRGLQKQHSRSQKAGEGPPGLGPGLDLPEAVSVLFPSQVSPEAGGGGGFADIVSGIFQINNLRDQGFGPETAAHPRLPLSEPPGTCCPWVWSIVCASQAGVWRCGLLGCPRHWKMLRVWPEASALALVRAGVAAPPVPAPSPLLLLPAGGF